MLTLPHLLADQGILGGVILLEAFMKKTQLLQFTFLFKK